MLVLRRRARESIVFDGGLVLTLVDVVDHQAWLCFSSPSMPVPVVLSPVSVGTTSICLAICAPRTVAHADSAVTMVVGDASAAPRDVVLLVNRCVGEQLCLEGISFGVASIDRERALLTVDVAELTDTVGVSVVAISGGEVKIGIAAPDHVRVYRDEVWSAMRSANEAAASWSPADLASLTSLRAAPDRDRSEAP